MFHFKSRQSSHLHETLSLFRFFSFLSLLIWASLLPSVNAGAQTWQYVYGPTTAVESGYSRVMPVKFACQIAYDPADPSKTAYDGYIAVGTSYSRDANGDIYVVRTYNNGTTAWEYQYDIFNNNSIDIGRSITELSDGTGFVITGWTTTAAGDKDVVVLSIDCQGAINWVRTIGTATADEVAYDIIETQTGNPFSIPPNFPMDLVIAGGSRDPHVAFPHWDAYLIRMNRAGGLVWSSTYDDLQHDQILYGLTELRSSLTNPATTGDIMAVGQHYDYVGATQQGYALRVNGATGAVTGNVKRGSAHYGGCAPFCGTDIFYSVTELLNPNENDGTGPYTGEQDVVIAGYSDSPGNKDVYMVKLNGGDICNVQADRLIGDGVGTQGKYDEVAHMVYEQPIQFTGYSLNQYDLLITGYKDVPATSGNERDVIFQSVASTNLAPLAAISMRYGITGNGKVEEGWSLHHVETNGAKTNGFILCGQSQSDPFVQGDPGDLYLIKTDPAGNSGTTTCERGYNPNSVVYGAPKVCMTPTVTGWGNLSYPTTRKYNLETALEACTQTTPKPASGSEENINEDIHFSSTVVPNVVSAGDIVRVALENSKITAVTVVLSNSLGERISREDRVVEPGSIEFMINTSELPKGIYFVAVYKDNRTWTERVVLQ